MNRQVQKLGAGARGIQAAGDVDFRIEITDAQIVSLADSIAQSLWNRLGGNPAAAAESLRRAYVDIKAAQAVYLSKVEAEFRNMVSSWCDSRLTQRNVRLFFDSVLSMHHEMLDRRECNNNLNIFPDVPILASWLEQMNNTYSYRRNENHYANAALSQYLMDTMLHNNAVINVTSSVAAELQLFIHNIITSSLNKQCSMDLLQRVEKLLRSQLKFAPVPSFSLDQLTFMSVCKQIFRRHSEYYTGKMKWLSSSSSETNDAHLIATVMTLNENAESPRSVLVTIDRDLIIASRTISQLYPAADRVVRHVYGAAWGSFCEDNESGANVDYMAIVSEAVVRSDQYLSSFHRAGQKTDITELRSLYKSIEDVASVAERFHRDTERRISLSNERITDGLVQLARQLEDGADILRELIAFLIHQLENWPANLLALKAAIPQEEP